MRCNDEVVTEMLREDGFMNISYKVGARGSIVG
jgi:hypothetical protein